MNMAIVMISNDHGGIVYRWWNGHGWTPGPQPGCGPKPVDALLFPKNDYAPIARDIIFSERNKPKTQGENWCVAGFNLPEWG